MHAVLEAVETRISRELKGVDEETSQRHPGERSHVWNIQQVVEHLVLTCRDTSKKLESRLQKGTLPRTAGRTPVQWVLQLMVLTFGHLPSGVPAFDETMPVHGPSLQADGEVLARQLRTEMESMDKLLDRCRQRFGMERVAVHPLLGALRVDQWRRYHALHIAHHVSQLQRVREQVAPQLVQDTVRATSLTKELHIPAQRSAT